ncbi:MAG TPA: FHA domain-containing protein [Candidatus Dormibacteraeota bacterium]|jgi:predicted component of type VI protein secretion system|nr:FHA domain-containing protein [Candidatus Dormibacteraeota bacterium]
MAIGPALTYGDKVFPLNKVTNSIGRKDRITNMVPDVDLATVDDERAVSRKHAEASYQAGKILLRDVGSTNGTTINGEALQLQVERELVDGDQVSLGGFEVVYAASAEWPAGVEAQWPAEPAVALETQVYHPEETAVMRPDETAVFAPGELKEPAEAAPAESELAGAADVYTPAPEPEAPPAEAVAPAEAAPVAEAPVVEAAPAPEEAPVAAASAEESMSFVPCTNHPHLPAVGLCPGCLDPFCIDCLPERPGQPLACNRCAGILMRLAAATAATPVAAAAAAPVATAPEAGGFPPPAPNYAPQAAAPEEKKKKWPF